MIRRGGLSAAFTTGLTEKSLFLFPESDRLSERERIVLFLPVSREEISQLGWDRPDVILVSGDAYIDSPFSGVAVIGKYLMKHGFRVAVISQPSVDDGADITALGEPRLFWGISAGCVDSMVANYTASGKPRRQCDFTPGGVNNRRPDRASIVYTGLIRRYFKQTQPIVLGGVEASLRRIAHYDFKTDKVRRPLLFDAKADYLVYGMGEYTVCELARRLNEGLDVRSLDGICYLSREKPDEALELPSFEEVSSDKSAFHRMFRLFSDNSEAPSGRQLAQKCGDRWLIQNQPLFWTQQMLDEACDLSFERTVTPKIKGNVRAVDTIRFSMMSHRGCFGGCSFCAIAVHQGRRVISRSLASIEKEIDDILRLPDFKGIITDIGGPTANMYGIGCPKAEKNGACTRKRCLYPHPCPSLQITHEPLLKLLETVRRKPGIRKVFAASGVRPDLVTADSRFGETYIRALAQHHVSGQLKLAPESGSAAVLDQMKKPRSDSFLRFCALYRRACRKANKNQFISCYFMAAHPGETQKEAGETRRFIRRELDFHPEQVQIFTPTPSTWATCAYYTGLDEEGQPVSVEKRLSQKERFKSLITGKR